MILLNILIVFNSKNVLNHFILVAEVFFFSWLNQYLVIFRIPYVEDISPRQLITFYSYFLCTCLLFLFLCLYFVSVFIMFPIVIFLIAKKLYIILIIIVHFTTTTTITRYPSRDVRLKKKRVTKILKDCFSSRLASSSSAHTLFIIRGKFFHSLAVWLLQFWWFVHILTFFGHKSGSSV